MSNAIGNYGNNIDGHNVHFKMEDVKKQEDSSDSNGPISADEKKDLKEVGRTSSTSKGAGLGEEEDDDEEEITDSPYSDSKEFEPIQVVYLSGNITKSNPHLGVTPKVTPPTNLT